MKDIQPLTLKRAKARGVEIIKFEEVEELGANKNHTEVVSTTDYNKFNETISYKFIGMSSNNVCVDCCSLQNTRISRPFVTLPAPRETQRESC